MNHAVAKTQFMNHVWHMFILRPGEYIDMDAHAAQFTREVADVDIHPTGILATQDGERARVIGNHRNIQRSRKV